MFYVHRDTTYSIIKKIDILKKKVYRDKQSISSHSFHFLVTEEKKENSMGFLFETMFHQKKIGLRKSE